MTDASTPAPAAGQEIDALLTQLAEMAKRVTVPSGHTFMDTNSAPWKACKLISRSQASEQALKSRIAEQGETIEALESNSYEMAAMVGKYAAKLAKLEAEREGVIETCVELRAALEPFAKEEANYEGDVPDAAFLFAINEDGSMSPTGITVGDLRRAAALRSKSPNAKGEG